MKRMRTLGLCLAAVFALVAITATGASAKEPKKKNLTLSTAAGALKAGSAISEFSSNLIFETSAGNLECEENELAGSLTNNDAKKVDGTITSETSQGNFMSIPGACKTSATGPVLIQSSDLPWKAVFTPKKTGEVKGGPKVIFTSTFLALEGPNNKCTFEATKVKDTMNVSVEKEPVTVTTTKQTFKHAKKAKEQTSLCPTSGVLSGTFTGKSGGETLESQLTV
ncbi:MAG TPA: hypothetical protein VGG08_07910 [Solirubrobacteraceae bacterium]|jgi:hypothetical protein